MNSFKSLGRVIIVTSIITVLMTIGINIQTNQAFEILNRNEQTIDAVTLALNNNELPLRVFSNIAQQAVTSDEKYEVLSNAYLKNKDKFTAELDNFLKDINSLEFEAYELIVFDIQAKEKDELKQRLRILTTDVSSMKDQMTSKFQVPLIRDLEAIHQLEEEYYLVKEQVIAFHEVYNIFSKNIREKYLLVFSLMLYFSLALLSLMAYVVFRMVRRDFKFISKTYDLLEDHDYDIEKLQLNNPFFKEEKDIKETVVKMFDEQKTLKAFKDLINQTYHMDDIIDMLFDRLNKTIHVDRVGIAFIDYRRGYIIAEYGVASYETLHLGPGYEVPIGKTSLKKLINNHEGLINNDVQAYKEKNPKSRTLELIINEGIQSNMIIPLVTNNVVFGFIFVSSKEKNHFEEEDLRFISKIIYEISGALNRAYLLKIVLAKMTTTFAKLVDRKDNETGDHILRMVSYSVIIAEGIRKMNLSTHPMDRKTILEIERHASVHDIGKVGIPDNILKKPGKLSSEEWEIMKNHVTIGGEIFSELRSDFGMFETSIYQVAEQIAKFHHEKFDGSGYPYKLRGAEIPLVARIVALADVFDALTSERVYKKAFTFEKALEIIDESTGKHFDPVVVEAFYNELDEIRKVYDKNL